MSVSPASPVVDDKPASVAVMPEAAPQTPAAQPGLKRDRLVDVDAVRGLCLIAIFVYHCLIAHHRLYQLTHPFLFDAALIFISVSGFMAAYVYGSRAHHPWRMLAGLYRRVLTIALVHVGLVITLAVMLLVDDWHSAGLTGSDGMRTFFAAPRGGIGEWILAVGTLQHQPVLFDILPIYIICLGLAPLVLLGTTVTRLVVLAVSWTMWLLTWWNGWHQTDALSGASLHFSVSSWQMVFFTSCVVALERKRIAHLPGKAWFEAVSWVVVGVGLVYVCVPYALSAPQDVVWENVIARAGMVVDLPTKVEKTTLHPLLVVSFIAAAFLWWRHHAILFRLAQTWPGRQLAVMGSFSLPIFALGTVLCIGTAWLYFRKHIGEGQPAQGFTTLGMLIGQIIVIVGILVQWGFAHLLARHRSNRIKSA